MLRSRSFDLVSKAFDNDSSKFPKLKGSVGADLHGLEQDRAIRTDPAETRRRRTIKLTRDTDKSWGFTLQTYGIRNKRTQMVEVMSYVDYVEMNGPAWVAGMRRGDIILSVNGESVEPCTHKELVSKVKSCGRDLRLVVLFEDCCHKVELHERYIRLKKLLHQKMKELKGLEAEEKRISEGIPLSRMDLFRQSTYSSTSSNWDVYSEIISPSAFDNIPVNRFAFRDNCNQSFSEFSTEDSNNSTESLSLDNSLSISKGDLDCSFQICEIESSDSSFSKCEVESDSNLPISNGDLDSNLHIDSDSNFPISKRESDSSLPNSKGVSDSIELIRKGDLGSSVQISTRESDSSLPISKGDSDSIFLVSELEEELACSFFLSKSDEEPESSIQVQACEVQQEGINSKAKFTVEQLNSHVSEEESETKIGSNFSAKTYQEQNITFSLNNYNEQQNSRFDVSKDEQEDGGFAVAKYGQDSRLFMSIPSEQQNLIVSIPKYDDEQDFSVPSPKYDDGQDVNISLQKYDDGKDNSVPTFNKMEDLHHQGLLPNMLQNGDSPIYMSSLPNVMDGEDVSLIEGQACSECPLDVLADPSNGCTSDIFQQNTSYGCDYTSRGLSCEAVLCGICNNVDVTSNNHAGKDSLSTFCQEDADGGQELQVTHDIGEAVCVDLAFQTTVSAFAEPTSQSTVSILPEAISQSTKSTRTEPMPQSTVSARTQTTSQSTVSSKTEPTLQSAIPTWTEQMPDKAEPSSATSIVCAITPSQVKALTQTNSTSHSTTPATLTHNKQEADVNKKKRLINGVLVNDRDYSTRL